MASMYMTGLVFSVFLIVGAFLMKQDGKPYNGPAARANVKLKSQKLLVARILVPRSPTDVVAPFGTPFSIPLQLKVSRIAFI